MKKKILVTLWLFCCMAWVPLWANTEVVNGITWNYTVSDGKASVDAVSETVTGAIVIPATLGGYPVTSIGDWAFDGCSGLTSVTIPSSVRSIGDYAFRDCVGLTSVTIQPGVTSIGDSAFDGCSGLTSVTIPSSVTSIGDGAFVCDNLRNIVVAADNPNYKSVDGCLLSKNGTLLVRGPSKESVTIPPGVTRIGEWAFYGCSGLKSVTIPSSVTSIADGLICCGWLVGAFAGCSGLTSVTIPSSVRSIGIAAFSGCSGLNSVTVPSSVTSIGKYAFDDCSGLTSVKFEGAPPDGFESAELDPDMVRVSYNKQYASQWAPLLSGLGFQDDTEREIYTVTFDPNGGIFGCNPSTFEVAEGDAVDYLPYAQKSNAEFLGWFTAKTGGTEVTEETVITKNVTFYAHWFEYKTVKLTVGGGTTADPESGSSVATAKLRSGSEATISFDTSKICDKNGNTIGAFQKWVVEPATADLGGWFDPYNSETTIVLPDRDVKVTAQYVANVAAYLTYELNREGYAEEETSFYWSPDGGKTLLGSGTRWPLAAGTVTVSFYAKDAAGKVSAAWKAPGGVKLTVPKRGSWTEREECCGAGKMVSVTYYEDPAEITEREWFVAADGAKQITFNANGGKCAVASRWYLDGGTYYTLPTPEPRKGYVFDGWQMRKTTCCGIGYVSVDDEVDFSEHEAKPTLYARWLKAYTLTLKGSGLTINREDYKSAISVLGGTEIAISAPSETKGKGGTTMRFQKWSASKSADFGTGFDAGASETTLVMPAADVTLTATYVNSETAAYLTMDAAAAAQEVSEDFAIEPDFSQFQWSTDGKTWYRSGARALLAAGKVTVQWRSLSDSWIAPTTKRTFTLAAGDDRYGSSDAFTYVPVLAAHAGLFTASDGEWRSSDVGGTVSLSPADGRLLPNKAVTLTAKAAKGFVFVGWAYRDYICCALFGSYMFAGTSATLKVAEAPAEWISRADGKVHYVAVFRRTSDYADENMDDVFGYLPATGLVGASEIEVDNGSPSVECLAYVGCAVRIDVLAGCKATAWPLAFKTGGTLPKGLKFDAKTGVLSGTPTQAGTSRFSVTVTDPAGHARTLAFEMDVRPMPVAGDYRALLTGNDIDGVPAAALLELSVTSAGKATAKVTGMDGTVSCTPALTMKEGRFVFSFDGVVGKTAVSLSVNTGVCEDGTVADDGSAYYMAHAKGESLRCCTMDGWLYGDVQHLDKTRSVEKFAGKYLTAVLSAGAYDEDGEGRWRVPSEVAANGYLTVTVDKKGAVKYAGQLADGEKVSGSGVLFVDEYGESAQVILFAAPAGYKKKGFAALRLLLSSDGSLASSGGLWRVPPLLDQPTDYDSDGGDTSVFLPGVLSLSASGSVYSALSDLTDYYLGLSLSSAGSPQMELTTTCVTCGLGEYVDALSQFGNPVLTGGKGGKVTIEKSAAPWKDADGQYHYDVTKEDRYGETQEITNPSGLTLAFTPATGIFSGKFNIFFDWETYKWNAKTEAETVVYNHKAVSVSYSGVVVNDGGSCSFAHGFGSGCYAGKFTFPYYDAKEKLKTKTYTKKTAYSVDWSF